MADRINILNPNKQIVSIPADQKDSAIAQGYSEIPADAAPAVPPVAAPTTDTAAVPAEPAPVDRVNVIKNDTGEIVSLPRPQAEMYAGPGKLYTIAGPGDLERHDAAQKAKEEADDQSVLGAYAQQAVGSAVKGFNNLQQEFGGLPVPPGQYLPPNKLRDPLGINNEVTAAHDAATLQARQEAHPVATFLGEATPSALAAATLGPAADAASALVPETILGSKLLSTAVSSATEWGTYDTYNVMQHLIDQDPGGAAESLRDSMLSGGLFGPAMKGLGSLKGLLAEPATGALEEGAVAGESASERELRVASNLKMKEFGIPPGKINADSIEDFNKMLQSAKESGVITGNETNPKIWDKLEQAFGDSGPKVGEAIKQLDTAEGKASIISQQMHNAYQEITGLAGGALSKTTEIEAKAAQDAVKTATERVQTAKEELTAATKEYEPFAMQKFINNSEESIAAKNRFNQATQNLKEGQSQLAELKVSAKEAAAKAAAPSGFAEHEMQAAKALKPILREIQVAGERGTFAETQLAKKFAREQITGADNVYANDIRKRASGILNKYIGAAEDAAAAKLPNSAEAIAKLQGARTFYRFESEFGKNIASQRAKEIEKAGGIVGFLKDLHFSRHSAAGIGGSIVGGMIGGPPGAAFGMGLTVGGSILLKKLAESAESNVSKKAMKTILESAQPNKTAILHQMQSQNSKILDAAKDLVSHIDGGKILKPLVVTGAIKYFLPDKGVGQTHAQQVDTLRNAVTANMADLQTFTDKLNSAVAPLRQEGLDKVADDYVEGQTKLMKLLSAILPEDPEMSQSHPFSAKAVVSEISPAMKYRYERTLSVVADPVGTLTSLTKSNQISDFDVAVASIMAPSTLQKLRQNCLETAIKSKPNLSLQQQMSMQILFGSAKEDQASQQTALLQSSYPPPAPPPQPGGKSKGKMSASSSENIADSALTTSQHAAQGLNSSRA